MPFKRKSRWKRFVKKIKFVAEKDLGTRTVVRNATTSLFLSGPIGSAQQVQQLALYPINHGALSWLQDISSIMSTDTDIPATGKVPFHSGILDMTMVNRSNDEALSGMSVELDVYDIICSKNFENATGDKGLQDVFGMGATSTVSIGAAPGITITGRGVTPLGS